MRHGLLHHRDSAQARTSIVAMAAIFYHDFELLHHLPHSVDLATSDFRVFQSVEDSLCRKTFERVENVIYAQNDRPERLEHCWKKSYCT